MTVKDLKLLLEALSPEYDDVCVIATNNIRGAESINNENVTIQIEEMLLVNEKGIVKNTKEINKETYLILY